MKLYVTTNTPTIPQKEKSERGLERFTININADLYDVLSVTTVRLE